MGKLKKPFTRTFGKSNVSEYCGAITFTATGTTAIATCSTDIAGLADDAVTRSGIGTYTIALQDPATDVVGGSYLWDSTLGVTTSGNFSVCLRKGTDVANKVLDLYVHNSTGSLIDPVSMRLLLTLKVKS